MKANKLTPAIALISLGLLFQATPTAMADPVVFVPAQAVWNYATVPTDLWQNWNTVGYDSFDWSTAIWSVGQAAFGDEVAVSYKWANTLWVPTTDLALRLTVAVANLDFQDVVLNLAIDNGVVVFINGVEVFKGNKEGNYHYWDFSVPVASSYFQLGDNTIDVLLEDHGGSTFFDMLLAGVPVPDPDTDDDGVLNDADECPNSILSQTVIIDGCDSGVSNTLFPTGCSISDDINLCAMSAKSHDEFVKCTAQYLTNLVKCSGILTGKQKGAIQDCASKVTIR